jgi:hypothetical protein
MRTALLVLVLALTACTDTDETTEPTATEPTATEPTATEPPAASSAPTTVPSGSDLPACDAVEPTATPTGWDHPDCRTQSGGDPTSTAIVRYAETDADTGDTPIAIDIDHGAGIPPFRIEETIGVTFATPHWQDLDADGSFELLVPLRTGNVNTDYAIWASPEPGVELVRVGEVGASGFAISQDGYVIALSRGGAASYFAAFMRIIGAELLPIATVESALDTGTCTLFDDGGLAAIGLDVDTAEARFCDDPAVVTGG